jgi:hypothetical protein
MVLYDYDFVCGNPVLNLRGKDRLCQIVDLVQRTPFPVIVERTPWNPGLAEVRRLDVINELSLAGVVLPPERVVIGPPTAVGLSGAEAVRIYRNLLDLTEHKGIIPGAAGGATAGTGPAATLGGGPGAAGGGIGAAPGGAPVTPP